jgi:hypothetical protein
MKKFQDPQTKNREFISPANLVELRAQHNSMQKILKSDLKRCTAFVKKVNISFHCNVPETQYGMLVSKYMLKACLSGRCGIISAVLAVASTLE